MSLLEWRGGIPHVRRLTTLGTTPVRVVIAETLRRLPEYSDGRSTGHGHCKWITIQNHDATNGLRVYFHEGDKDNADNYVLVQPRAAGNVPVWQGPVEDAFERENGSIWVAADAGSVAALDITFYLRRN